MCDQPLATLDTLSSISIDHTYSKLARTTTNLHSLLIIKYGQG